MSAAVLWELVYDDLDAEGHQVMAKHAKARSMVQLSNGTVAELRFWPVPPELRWSDVHPDRYYHRNGAKARVHYKTAVDVERTFRVDPREIVAVFVG